MTRNLTEPIFATKPPREGEQLAYNALAELLTRANLHSITGKLILTIDVNQGNVRAARIGSQDENFKS